jgi:DNA-binding LacI/PurR family transcriptional regulator
MPVAVYDAELPGRRGCSVRFHYEKGMRQLVQHLHALGHRRMAYIGYPLQLGPTDERRDAFVAATKELRVTERYLAVRRESDLSSGRDAARELLSMEFVPTAILCVNDLVAVGVLRELQSRKISVPDDISVTGFDNIEISEFSTPSLTTINIPRDRIAAALFRSLSSADVEALRNSKPYLIDPQLIVRESTGNAPKSSRS